MSRQGEADMKKGVIIYKSKYGAAEKYAVWLKEMTGYDIVKTSEADPKAVSAYDSVILCGGIYASGIAGLEFLKKNIGRLRADKIAMLCVGASPYDESALSEIKAHNMTGALQDIPLFYGRGAWDESRMTFIDRKLCRLLQKSVAKKDPDTYESWMKALMSAVGQSCDWTDKKYLAPLIKYLNDE